MDEPKKWQGLDTKLSEGHTLRSACRLLGIDLKEAQKWVNEIRELEEIETEAERVGLAAVRNDGISALVDLAKLSDDDDVRMKAASALLVHYREEQKRLARQTKSDDNGSQSPLFGPWDIKKPGV